jgi:hypothetical protein
MRPLIRVVWRLCGAATVAGRLGRQGGRAGESAVSRRQAAARCPLSTLIDLPATRTHPSAAAATHFRRPRTHSPHAMAGAPARCSARPDTAAAVWSSRPPPTTLSAVVEGGTMGGGALPTRIPPPAPLHGWAAGGANGPGVGAGRRRRPRSRRGAGGRCGGRPCSTWGTSPARAARPCRTRRASPCASGTAPARRSWGGMAGHWHRPLPCVDVVGPPLPSARAAQGTTTQWGAPRPAFALWLCVGWWEGRMAECVEGMPALPCAHQPLLLSTNGRRGRHPHAQPSAQLRKQSSL